MARSPAPMTPITRRLLGPEHDAALKAAEAERDRARARLLTALFVLPGTVWSKVMAGAMRLSGKQSAGAR